MGDARTTDARANSRWCFAGRKTRLHLIRQPSRPDMSAPSERNPEDKLRERLEAFPPEFRELVLGYRRRPAPELLDRIAHGILAFHGGETFEKKFAEKQGDVRLLEDLGFDSLSLVDISFQAEEFLGIIIQLEDFPQIRTLREMQAFLRAKATDGAAVGKGGSR
jgi:acyl carrier protein